MCRVTRVRSDRYSRVFAEYARFRRAGRIISAVTTALAIGLVLAAWLVMPLPLAVLVGRWMRAGGVAARI
jgi:hypothetical protein